MRSRRLVRLASMVLLAVDACAIGCSSSPRPAATDGTVSPPGVDARPYDAARDDASDAGDAADDVYVPPFDCLDDKPAPVEAGVDAGSADCPANGSCAAYCADIHDHYKLGVAQVAIRCVNALLDCSTPGAVRNCVDQALLAACKDPSSPSYCAGLVIPCDPNAGKPNSNIDEPGCESFANGLGAAGRATFAGCIQSKIDAGTCPLEVAQCADDIRQ